MRLGEAIGCSGLTYGRGPVNGSSIDVNNRTAAGFPPDPVAA